jgi:haloalkane dehalogenase
MNTWMWPVDDDWYYRAFSAFMDGLLGRFLIKRFNFFVNGVMKLATADKSRLSGDIHEH